MITTIKENELYYTPRQIEQAQQARKLMHTLGFPTVDNLRKMIQSNAIDDNPVTLKDVKIAEAVYGKDVASLKGKTTRSKPKPVVNNYVEIP